jgi:hypothetical protein
MFAALLVTGLVILPMGLVALGKAMAGAPGFGGREGGTTVVLGVLGLAAATALLVDVTPIGVVGVLVLVAFNLILGWRTHRTLGSKTHVSERASRSAMSVDA